MATRTLNPLPFEHLEPKRFEDLVRQLLYDFLPWATLEATGRSGADEGFDARGVEAQSAPSEAAAEDEDEDFPNADVPAERVWLIQCKREKRIGPKKLLGHLDALPPESVAGLYGLIFVAASDFSMAARVAAREWARAKGIQEVHIWGRGEIEDQLVQPKNDNLLFAYFGISLQIRRRGAATKIRREIALKRRIRKIQELGGWPGPTVILRDPSDERYPKIDIEGWNRGEYRWRPAASKGAGVHGLRLVVRQHYGYFDPKTGAWDFATGYNYIYPYAVGEMWPPPKRLGSSDEILSIWNLMPRSNQVHFRLVGTLPYEEIIEIDLEPDNFCEFPTVFTTFRALPEGGFAPTFLNQVDVELDGSSGWSPPWHRNRHVRVFPPELRDVEWEKNWTDRNGIRLSDESIPAPVDVEQEKLQREIRSEIGEDT